MGRRLARSLLVLSVVLIAGNVRAQDEPGRRVMGTITAADALHLEVKTTEGEIVSAALNPETRIRKGDRAGTLADLEPGRHAVLRLRDGLHDPVVAEVQLGIREQPHEHAGTPPMRHGPGTPESDTESDSLEPHQRMGSGTSWQPDNSPMHAYHWRLGSWEMTTHGLAFVLYDHQGGPRGATRGVAPNWVMTMARRPLGPGALDLRAMLSLDPVTVRPRGYPLLFQTGETLEGRPLVDAQHPHDLFMEVAGIYTWRLRPRAGLQLYAAPVGEPALGPVAFPHRVSAADIPVAVLGHHLQDSTHISFGVLTGGLIAGGFKLEGSWFNGHEPDEQRWGFDPIRLNSSSARMSYASGRHWVFQVSRGWLDSPDQLAPGEDVTRTTASALYARSSAQGSFAGALIVGRNDEEDHTEDSLAVEATLTYARRNQVFGRFERVDRTGLVDVTDPGSEPLVTINAWTLGVGRDLGHVAIIPVSAGIAVTLYEKPDLLDPSYGRRPISTYLFLRLRAPRMEMGGHQGSHAADPRSSPPPHPGH